jgi:hypothetical protein
MQISVEGLKRLAGDLALENRLKDETIIALQARAAELEARLQELAPEETGDGQSTTPADEPAT